MSVFKQIVVQISRYLMLALPSRGFPVGTSHSRVNSVYYCEKFLLSKLSESHEEVSTLLGSEMRLIGSWWFSTEVPYTECLIYEGWFFLFGIIDTWRFFIWIWNVMLLELSFAEFDVVLKLQDSAAPCKYQIYQHGKPSHEIENRKTHLKMGLHLELNGKRYENLWRCISI